MSGSEAGLKRAPSPSIDRPGKRAHTDNHSSHSLLDSDICDVDPSRDSMNAEATQDEAMAEDEHMSDDEVPRRKLDKGKGKAKAPLVLPETVWQKIFEFYYDTVCESWNESNRLPHALTPLLLNREITCFALPILYRHPHIDYHRVIPFIRCITISDPNTITPRKKLVRHLTVRPSPPVKLKDMLSDEKMRELNSVHAALPTLLQHFPALFSFTLRDTLITSPWSANTLFDAFRRITPKKARLEIRMWDLYGSQIGSDLISRSYPNIHAPFTGIAAVPSAPGSFENLTHPVGGGVAFRNGRWGDSAAGLMQECWREALLNGGEVQFPGWWLDPRPPQQDANQHQPQGQPQGIVNPVPLPQGGASTNAVSGAGGSASGPPGSASTLRAITIRALSNYMQSNPGGPMAPYPTLPTIGPSHIQPAARNGNYNAHGSCRFGTVSRHNHSRPQSDPHLSYDQELAASLQAQFDAEDGDAAGPSTSTVTSMTGPAPVDANAEGISDFEIIDHPDGARPLTATQGAALQSHRVKTQSDAPALHSSLDSNAPPSGVTEVTNTVSPAVDFAARVEHQQLAPSGSLQPNSAGSEVKAGLEGIETQARSQKLPALPTGGSTDSGPAKIHQFRALSRVKPLSRTDLFTASSANYDTSAQAFDPIAVRAAQVSDGEHTGVTQTASFSAPPLTATGPVPALTASNLSRDTPNAEGLTEFAGMALSRDAKLLLRALMNRHPSEERQRYIRDYLALLRSGGVRGVPPQRSMSGNFPPNANAHALYNVSGGKTIVTLGPADHSSTPANETELAHISRWAYTQAAVPMQVPVAPQMPGSHAAIADEDESMAEDDDEEWLEAADRMDDATFREHMMQRYGRVGTGRGQGSDIVNPSRLDPTNAVAPTVPMPRPAGSYTRMTASGGTSHHPAGSAAYLGASSLAALANPTAHAGNSNAVIRPPPINEHRASATSSYVLASEIRVMLRALIRDRWSPTLQALSFVALDPLASIISRAPELDLWTEIAVPHIRVHLPRGCNSLSVFKGNEELIRDRRRRLIAEGHLPAGDPADGDMSRIVGGDGNGNDLLHPANRLFEIEVNTLAEMRDDMWFNCGPQLPPQVCRILTGEHDWREVRIGPSVFGAQSDYSESVGDPSPATSQFNSPTFSFLSTGSDDDVPVLSGDEGECYDAEAARAQREKIAARAAESAKSKLNQALSKLGMEVLEE